MNDAHTLVVVVFIAGDRLCICSFFDWQLQAVYMCE